MNLELNTIYNLDCVEGMKKIDSESVDLIVADPPFAIGVQDKQCSCYTNKRKQQNIIGGYREIKQEDYLNFSIKWLKESFRILKETGSIYVISGTTNLGDIFAAIKIAGFAIIDQIIWHFNFGVRTENKFIISHYPIIYACKNPSKRKFYTYCRFNQGKENYSDRSSVWFIKKEFWKNCLKTPNHLPLEMVKKIIQYSSNKSNVVCDPFSGSGQTFWACKELNRNFIGFEICKEYCDFSKQRISNNLYLIKNKRVNIVSV